MIIKMPAITENLFISYVFSVNSPNLFSNTRKIKSNRQEKETEKQNKTKQDTESNEKKHRSPHSSSILSTGLQTYIQVQIFL